MLRLSEGICVDLSMISLALVQDKQLSDVIQQVDDVFGLERPMAIFG